MNETKTWLWILTGAKSITIFNIKFTFSAGAFMGFDSELEDSGSECDIEGQKASIAAHNLRAAAKPVNFVDPTDHLPIFEDQLLDGLQLWLDRLFEGSTYRYHINYWPEFPISPANFHTRQVQGWVFTKGGIQ